MIEKVEAVGLARGLCLSCSPSRDEYLWSQHFVVRHLSGSSCEKISYAMAMWSFANEELTHGEWSGHTQRTKQPTIVSCRQGRTECSYRQYAEHIENDSVEVPFTRSHPRVFIWYSLCSTGQQPKNQEGAAQPALLTINKRQCIELISTRPNAPAYLSRATHRI